MSNIATTIEQSKHLLELGLSKETADMSYSEEYFGKDKDGNDEWCWQLNACKFVDVEGIIPAWSLSALLEVIPKTIVIDNQNSDVDDIYVLSIEYTGDDNEPEISYMDYTSTFIHSVGGEDELTAVYKMVCWLLEQGLIKKEDNNE